MSIADFIIFGLTAVASLVGLAVFVVNVGTSPRIPDARDFKRFREIRKRLGRD